MLTTVNSDPISYIIAKSSADKKGNFTVTPVSWKKAPIYTKLIKFKSTTSRALMVVPQSLPTGYQMEWHPSWTEVFDHICDPTKIKSASFIRLNSIQEDYELLIEMLNLDRADNPIYDFRKDYLKYRSEIDESWYELKHNITNSIDRLFISCYQISEINNTAPSTNEALKKMFPELSSDAINSIADKLVEYTTSNN